MNNLVRFASWMLLLILMSGCGVKRTFFISHQDTAMDLSHFDWQGHRGCRGLMPENTIPAFLHALTIPEVTTLELDVSIAADHSVIVSHEPWMSSEICRQPDGTPIAAEKPPAYKLYGLTYEQIKKFDCGSWGNKRFPMQQSLPTHKPSLDDLVSEVRQYCQENGRPMPEWNIEIKSRKQWDNTLTPPVDTFTQLLLDKINALGIASSTTVQSFDMRALRHVHRIAPEQRTVLLIEKLGKPSTFIEKLGFKPDVYSPYYRLLTKKSIRKLHDQGIKVIPWTVNDPKKMRKLINKGVDGIITDYPNRIAEVMASLKN